MAPGDSTPEKTAPERLELVQRFVNSVDLETGEDELSSPEALRGWLAERDLIGAGRGGRPGGPAPGHGRSRGPARAADAQQRGGRRRRSAWQRLDRAAGARRRARRLPGRRADPSSRRQGEGVDGALARLLAIVAAAVEQGNWSRLKACPRESCLWAFYDHSKNRSGRWCRMEACGNIEKARAFRERRRGAGA